LVNNIEHVTAVEYFPLQYFHEAINNRFDADSCLLRFKTYMSLTTTDSSRCMLGIMLKVGSIMASPTALFNIRGQSHRWLFEQDLRWRVRRAHPGRLG
jgi:hypothetical protein